MVAKLFDSTQAVLVSLNIGTWANNAIDRAVSVELAEQKNLSDKSMARVWKTLLPKSDTQDAIKSIESKARRFHIINTSPGCMMVHGFCRRRTTQCT